MGPYGPALYSNGVLLAFHTTFYFYDVIYFLASSRACVQVRSTTRARAQVGHGDGWLSPVLCHKLGTTALDSPPVHFERQGLAKQGKTSPFAAGSYQHRLKRQGGTPPLNPGINVKFKPFACTKWGQSLTLL